MRNSVGLCEQGAVYELVNGGWRNDGPDLCGGLCHCGTEHVLSANQVRLRSELLAGVFTGMRHIITINFTASAIALVALSTGGRGNAVAWLVAAQFAGYAAIYLVTSLRLSGALELFQWIPFAATAIVTALGAIAIP